MTTSKVQLYKNLLDSNVFKIKEFTNDGEAPFIININNILSNNKLFDSYSLLIENYTKKTCYDFNKICALSPSSIPYATNIATSFQKGLLYINDIGNDKTEKNNIKNIKVEGGLEIDDKIILIETVTSPDYFINNVISKITKFGGQIVAVIIIFDKTEGEFINLLIDKVQVLPIININEFCTTLENNNYLDMFCSERVKFYCEKKMKENLNYFTKSE
jgi:orotate phosphoribosyltransferase